MATGTFILGSGTLVNADVSALANLAHSKLAQRTNGRLPVDLACFNVWDAYATRLPSDGVVESAVESAAYSWVATSADAVFFTAGRAYRVLGITSRVEVAGTDGGAVTAVVKKAASGTAITAGTALHTGSVNLKGTAATNQSLSLSATSSDLDIASGTSIGIDFTGTLTSATGTVTVLLQPAASADDLKLVTGAFATDPVYVGTGDVKATSPTKYARFLLSVPNDFETGQTLTLRLYCGMKTTIADGSAVIDVEAWRVDADGTLGATDICSTAQQSINSVTAATKDFVLSDLDTCVAGDMIDVRVKIAIVDAATVTAVIGAIWQAELLADLR